MTLKVGIIADDLTGALDTGTPFVEAGLSVAVAIDIQAADEALATGAEVVVINTASRALSPTAAAERVSTAARALITAAPSIIFKKIDSRLKGNIAAESAALAQVFGRKTIVVAPAIPDQQRFTRGGEVVGRGVDQPLPIAAAFAGHQDPIRIADADSDADLDRVVADHDWTIELAVGARGFGSAFARFLSNGTSGTQPFEPSRKTLYAFGSQDPITVEQMRRLEELKILRLLADAPEGDLLCGEGLALPALLRCTGDLSKDPGKALYRFAHGVRTVIDDTRPDTLMVGGGDTALAIFNTLGVRVLRPQGEIEAGIPWVTVFDDDGRQFRCAVKSGGFGNPDSLLKLVPRNQSA